MFELIRNPIKFISWQLKKKAIILCYHRIASEIVDPWSIAVSPENFEKQLQILTKYFRVVSVVDLINNFDECTSRKTVCLTFDDGYTDNHSIARPLLKKYNFPACFFIASGFTDSNHLFWWDELADIMLRSQTLPALLSIHIKDEPHNFDLGLSSTLSDIQREKITHWKYHQKPPSERCILFLKLWELIRPLHASEQQKVIGDLRKWRGYSNIPVDPEKLPMTKSQLQELSDDGLFTIGLHTSNHADLRFHLPNLQEQEIQENKFQLNSFLKNTADIMSFPYGSYNDDSINIAKRVLQASFTSKKEIMTNKTDRHQIGRYAIKNWNGTVFKGKLNDWFAKEQKVV